MFYVKDARGEAYQETFLLGKRSTPIQDLRIDTDFIL